MASVMKRFVAPDGLVAAMLCLWCCALTLTGHGEEVAAPIVLAQQGRPMARIIVPSDASTTVRAAAVLLSDCVFRSTKARLTVETEPGTDARPISIHCGPTTYVKGLSLALDRMDADGFVIAFPDARSIVIAGPTQYGTEFGVYEFLERYVGVRWLFPGDLGEFLPARDDLAIPMAAVRQEPAYHSRLLGAPGWWQGFWSHKENEKSLWARRNRMQTRMRFHHNLLRLFPPESYAQTHPEFSPILKGSRYLPKNNKVEGWQPCFTEPGTVSEAIKNICAYFKAHPDATSYSLGLNDGAGKSSSGHCECKRCLEAVGDAPINFVGRKNRSDLYYAWCNRVIAGVLEQHPHKHFGCLAYSEGAEPPKRNKVHPHLAPYMTYDRMKWYDAEIEKEGRELTRRWAAAASVLGWYDYIHGKQYVLPRIYFHKMAEYLRFGYEHKVRHYYAEAYPADDWHEGPKLYLTLKLLWNPNLDVDATLQEWYVNAVGAEAAPHLAQYFSLWEDFWARRATRTGWFGGSGSNQWLQFKSTGYLEALREEDLAQCERLLSETARLASGEPQQARAKFFLDSFRKRVTSQLITDALDHYRLNRDSGAMRISAPRMTNAFDKGFDGWGTWQRGTSKATFSWDKADGHAAPGALRVNLHGSWKTPVSFSRKCAVGDADFFRMTVWCKAEGLSADAVVSLTAKWHNKDGRWLSEKHARQVSLKDAGTGAWRELELVLRVPVADGEEAHHLVCLLAVRNAAEGIVRFDDFSLSEARAPDIE